MSIPPTASFRFLQSQARPIKRLSFPLIDHAAHLGCLVGRRKLSPGGSLALRNIDNITFK